LSNIFGQAFEIVACESSGAAPGFASALTYIEATNNESENMRVLHIFPAEVNIVKMGIREMQAASIS